MAELFEKAINRKGGARQRGEEKRVNKNGDVIPGKWRKYQQGWSDVTPQKMFVFWCAKWGTTLFGETPVKDLFSDGIGGQADKGQLLYGWGRETFEMIDECCQAHAEEDVKAN